MTKKKIFIIFFNSILVIVLGHFLNISSTGIISFMYTTIHAFLYGTWVGFGSAIVSIVIIVGSLVRIGDYSEINNMLAPIIALVVSGLVIGTLSDKMKSYGNILNIKNIELEKMKMSLESTNTELKMQLNNSNMLAKSLVSAKEAAEASNISKSEFLANMSHEIRTPMNGFLGMMQLMQMTQLTEEQEEYIRLSKMSSDALLVVINDILDYSKLEAGKMKLEKTVFNLGTVVNDIVSLFKLLAYGCTNASNGWLFVNRDNSSD